MKWTIWNGKWEKVFGKENGNLICFPNWHGSYKVGILLEELEIKRLSTKCLGTWWSGCPRHWCQVRGVMVRTAWAVGVVTV